MKKLIFLLILISFLFNCGSNKDDSFKIKTEISSDERYILETMEYQRNFMLKNKEYIRLLSFCDSLDQAYHLFSKKLEEEKKDSLNSIIVRNNFSKAIAYHHLGKTKEAKSLINRINVFDTFPFTEDEKTVHKEIKKIGTDNLSDAILMNLSEIKLIDFVIILEDVRHIKKIVALILQSFDEFELNKKTIAFIECFGNCLVKASEHKPIIDFQQHLLNTEIGDYISYFESLEKDDSEFLKKFHPHKIPQIAEYWSSIEEQSNWLSTIDEIIKIIENYSNKINSTFLEYTICLLAEINIEIIKEEKLPINKKKYYDIYNYHYEKMLVLN